MFQPASSSNRLRAGGECLSVEERQYIAFERVAADEAVEIIKE
jgi:hypothetical protein